jgi:signal transduction histidine kinase
MIKLTSWASLRQDMTGRWSFEAKGFLFIMPLQAIFSVLLIRDLSSITELGLAIFANALAFALCAILFFVYAKTLFKDRKNKNVSLAVVIGAGATLGLVKGVATGYFVAIFGLEPEVVTSITSRIIQTTGLGIWWVPTLAIIFTYRERFKLQRDTLISERVYKANAGQAQNTFGKSKKLIDSNAELKKFVAGVRQQLADGAQIAGDNYKSLAEVVRKIIQDDLRPLSHRMWERENERLTDFSFRDLANLAVTKYVFVSWPALPIYFVTVAPANIAAFGLMIGVGLTLFQILVIAIVFPLAKFLAPKKPFLSWLYFISLTLVCIGIAAYSTVTFLDVQVDGNFLISAFAQFTWVMVMIFVTGLIRSALASQSKIQRELIELVGDERAVENLEFNRKRLMNRELAQYLHGHVQNRLMAIAIRLEQATALSNPSVVVEELSRIEELLENAVTGYSRDSSLQLADEVRAVGAQWHEIVDLDLNIDTSVETLNLDPSLVNDIGQAVNELISNSIHHGFAAKVAIAMFMPTNNKLIITSFDDGLGPRDGNPGLGSSLFESLCGNNWSLSSAIGGGAIGRLEIGFE